jgi:hypothetical protein
LEKNEIKILNKIIEECKKELPNSSILDKDFNSLFQKKLHEEILNEIHH